eukprot:Opistho-2@37591
MGSVASTAFQPGDELLDANGRDLTALSAADAMGILSSGTVLTVTVRSPLSAVEQHKELLSVRHALPGDSGKRKGADTERKRISSPAQLLRVVRGKSSNHIVTPSSGGVTPPSANLTSTPTDRAPMLREKSLSSSGLPLSAVERKRAAESLDGSGSDSIGSPRDRSPSHSRTSLQRPISDLDLPGEGVDEQRGDGAAECGEDTAGAPCQRRISSSVESSTAGVPVASVDKMARLSFLDNW